MRRSARAIDAAAAAELQRIPGIGPAMAGDLLRLGVRRIADLRGRDPQQLYHRLTRLDGTRHDPWVLYTFRCAVYFASTGTPDPERLKWWNWQDTPAPRRARARAA